MVNNYYGNGKSKNKKTRNNNFLARNIYIPFADALAINADTHVKRRSIVGETILQFVK